MHEKEDNIIGYIEYLSDDGKIIGYVTPFTDVDKFRKEILEAAEVGMPITPVVFPDKLDKPLGLPRDIYWPGGFRKEKRQTYPYEIYQTNNRNFVFRNYAYAKTRMKVADYKLVYFDGIINNTPTTDELEAKARSGEQISLAEYAAALKAEQEQGKEKKPGKKAEKKPSIRAQLKADKERAAQRKQARSKSQDLERS